MPTFLQNALEIASKVRDPVAAEVVGAVLVFGFLVWQRGKHRLNGRHTVLGVVVIFTSCSLPLIAKWDLSVRGVYAVRVIVLGTDRNPVENATVVCSPGGEQKKIVGGWECDIPPANRPQNGTFTAYATVRSAFLAGSGHIQLSSDYKPVLTIQLNAENTAWLSGEVMGNNGRVLADARVSVVGHGTEAVVTGRDGDFSIRAHAANGQMVKVHVEAKGYPPYEGLQQAGDPSLSIQLQP
ncbi:MAG TPA: carboxypeptidase-like regulatory domain-containing protein [Acidisarcina sp.]